MSSQKAKKVVTKQDAVDKISNHIVKEIFRLIDSQREVLADDGTMAVIYSVLGGYISSVAYDALSYTSPESRTNKAKFDEVSANFLNCKAGIQEAIAAGFQHAWQEFAGKEVEYYCKISAIQEPPSKKAH